jgi:hypothetical protein
MGWKEQPARQYGPDHEFGVPPQCWSKTAITRDIIALWFDALDA